MDCVQFALQDVEQMLQEAKQKWTQSIRIHHTNTIHSHGRRLIACQSNGQENLFEYLIFSFIFLIFLTFFWHFSLSGGCNVGQLMKSLDSPSRAMSLHVYIETIAHASTSTTNQYLGNYRLLDSMNLCMPCVITNKNICKHIISLSQMLAKLINLLKAIYEAQQQSCGMKSQY